LELTPARARLDATVSLQRLQSRHLIYPTDARFPDERAFRFKHALIRDAAYQSVRKRVRSELHERYAQWLERKTDDGVSEHDEILGYHLEQAYRSRADLGPLDEDGRALGMRAAGRLAGAGRRSLDLGLYGGAAKLLGRARELLPSDDVERDEVILDLAQAFVGAAERERAEATFDEVLRLARSKGDRRLELHAALASLNLRSSVDPALTASELMRAGNAAIPVFSELGDYRGLAKAWWLVSWAHLKLSRYVASADAAAHGFEHARQARDRREQARFLGTMALGLYWGPTPVDEGLRRCDALLAQGEGSRSVEAYVLRAQGVLTAMQGRFAEARSCVKRGERIHRELGQAGSAAGTAIEAAKVELLAEDSDAAERVLRDAYCALDRIGYRAFRSVVAARLVQALYDENRADEAAALARLTLDSAVTDDVFPRVICCAVRAKALALRGELAEAEVLGRSAVDAAAQTDDLELRGDALSDLAEVLRFAGRPAEAAGLIEAACAVYERKGDVVSVKRARCAAGISGVSDEPGARAAVDGLMGAHVPPTTGP
jgi:tetratricopeptide (TPR) repeat protein